MVVQRILSCQAKGFSSLTFEGTWYSSFYCVIPQLEIPWIWDNYHRTGLSLAARSGSTDAFHAVLAAMKEDLTDDEVGITRMLPSGDRSAQHSLTICLVEVVAP